MHTQKRKKSSKRGSPSPLPRLSRDRPPRSDIADVQVSEIAHPLPRNHHAIDLKVETEGLPQWLVWDQPTLHTCGDHTTHELSIQQLAQHSNRKNKEEQSQESQETLKTTPNLEFHPKKQHCPNRPTPLGPPFRSSVIDVTPEPLDNKLFLRDTFSQERCRLQSTTLLKLSPPPR